MVLILLNMNIPNPQWPNQQWRSLYKRVADFLQTAKKPLIVVTGPTGSGKSELGVVLALKIKGEVVNADSRQLYKGMEIGANTIPDGQRQRVPHHLLSFLDPDKVFTLAQYQQKAFTVIDDILSRNNIPLLVGGTGLYINAVCLNYAIPSVEPNEETRKNLEQRIQREGEDALRSELERNDPLTAASIQKGKHHALIRALEIVSRLGPQGTVKKRNAARYDCFFIFLEPNRKDLLRKIKQRVERQLEDGVVREIAALIKKGYDRENHAMTAIYAREVMDMMEGKCGMDDMKAKIVANTLSYVKRQETWLRGLQKQLSSEKYIKIPV